jgi:hypothetical protein
MKQHDEASRKYQTCLENQINLVYKRDPRAPPMPLNYFKANIFPKCQDARSDYIASQDAFGMDNKTKELDENISWVLWGNLPDILLVRISETHALHHPHP